MLFLAMVSLSSVIVVLFWEEVFCVCLCSGWSGWVRLLGDDVRREEGVWEHSVVCGGFGFAQPPRWCWRGAHAPRPERGTVSGFHRDGSIFLRGVSRQGCERLPLLESQALCWLNMVQYVALCLSVCCFLHASSGSAVAVREGTKFNFRYPGFEVQEAFRWSIGKDSLFFHSAVCFI